MTDILQDIEATQRIFIKYPIELIERNKELSHVDSALNDITHIIEFVDMENHTLLDLVKEQQKLLRERRILKDRINELSRILQFVNGFSTKKETLEKRIDKVTHQIRSIRGNFKQRSYEIRVRHDLEWLLKKRKRSHNNNNKVKPISIK